ncbi:hypothetical protein [Anaerobutyricum hallii]
MIFQTRSSFYSKSAIY